MLKMSIEHLHNIMNNDIQYYNWKHTKGTNCYAYALGLDVIQSKICHHAYMPGRIGQEVIGTECNYNFNGKIIEEQMFNDLFSLGVRCDIVTDDESLCLKDIKRQTKNYWDILLFTRYYWDEEEKKFVPDFHFVRIGPDGNLYHKWGWELQPESIDYDELKIHGYDFIKRYRLIKR